MNNSNFISPNEAKPFEQTTINGFPFPGTPNEWAEELGANIETIADDPVSHPKHYTSGKYEVIDIIEDQLGAEGFRGFALGNVLKYIMRSGKKDPNKTIEDLEKAAWYLNYYIKSMKGEKENDGDK